MLLVPFREAHLHASRCDINSGGSHFLHDVTGTDSGDNIVLVEHDFPGGVPSPTDANVTRDYLVDYDRAASVVVHARRYFASGAATSSLTCRRSPTLGALL